MACQPVATPLGEMVTAFAFGADAAGVLGAVWANENVERRSARAISPGKRGMKLAVSEERVGTIVNDGQLGDGPC